MGQGISPAMNVPPPIDSDLQTSSSSSARSSRSSTPRRRTHDRNAFRNVNECLMQLENPLDEDNGFAFNGRHVPSEIVVLILSFVDRHSLASSCKYVCKNWFNVLRDVWKAKAERELSDKFAPYMGVKRLPWTVYRSMVLNETFGRNLIKNHSGQRPHPFRYWKITYNAGDRWLVESPPVGLHDSDNTTYTSAFVTSYGQCQKEQTVDLLQEGLDTYTLDVLQPEITVSECYAARWDCGSLYELDVTLLSVKKKVLGEFSYHENLANWPGGWKEIKNTFKAYGPGVRYIRFIHGGRDTQFWAGHYGSKMCKATVIIPLDVMSSQHARSTEIKN